MQYVYPQPFIHVRMRYVYEVNWNHAFVLLIGTKKKPPTRNGSYGYRNPVLADGLSCVSGLTHRPFKHVTWNGFTQSVSTQPFPSVCRFNFIGSISVQSCPSGAYTSIRLCRRPIRFCTITDLQRLQVMRTMPSRCSKPWFISWQLGQQTLLGRNTPRLSCANYLAPLSFARISYCRNCDMLKLSY